MPTARSFKRLKAKLWFSQPMAIQCAWRKSKVSSHSKYLHRFKETRRVRVFYYLKKLMPITARQLLLILPKPNAPIWPMPTLRKSWQSRASVSAWSNCWQPVINPITEPLPMRKPNRHVCVIALLLLTCGCQSNSTPPPQLVVTQCKPPPAPAAWFMAPIEPDLTQRMLNELSESPVTVTKD